MSCLHKLTAFLIACAEPQTWACCHHEEVNVLADPCHCREKVRKAKVICCSKVMASSGGIFASAACASAEE